MTYHDGRFAALDIGTVTCRLLVADVEGGQVSEVAKEYAITDLGVGVDASGRLADDAMERVLATVDRYRGTLDRCDTDERPLRGLIAMATSAARDAANADEVTARLAERGVTLAVIPGEREAALTFTGASADFPGENLLVVDIGGGSTEIVAGCRGETPVASRSFNVGCRRVTERFLTDEEALAARGFTIDRVVAVAGTATSVVAVREAMAVYDSNRVHRAVVTSAELRAIEESLAALPLEKRKATVGLDPKRAGVIVAGLVILEEVLDLAAADAYTVSESDILNGMILEAASQ